MEPVDDYVPESETLIEYNEITERIEELRLQRKYYAAELKNADNEDDIIEFKYQMMKIKEELSPLISKQKILEYDLKTEELEKERNLIKENEQKEFEKACSSEADKIYKRLYVTLNDKQLNLLKKIFNISQNTRELIFEEMFEDNSYAEIIIITSLFEILPFSEMERIVRNDSHYLGTFYEYGNHELIFNKLKNLPDIKFMEKKADVKVVAFEDAFPYFEYIYDEDKESHMDYWGKEVIYDDVYDTFEEYRYFFDYI